MTSLQPFRIFPKLRGAAVPGGEPEVPACDFSLLEQQQPLPAAWGHFVCFFLRHGDGHQAELSQRTLNGSPAPFDPLL